MGLYKHRFIIIYLGHPWICFHSENENRGWINSAIRWNFSFYKLSNIRIANTSCFHWEGVRGSYWYKRFLIQLNIFGLRNRQKKTFVNLLMFSPFLCLFSQKHIIQKWQNTYISFRLVYLGMKCRKNKCFNSKPTKLSYTLNRTHAHTHSFILRL